MRRMSRVVVVEDDPVNAMLFRRILERRGGFRVTALEDVDELLRIARRGAVDVVVMDVSLANSSYEDRPVNGVELCRILKSEASTRGLPVILATAHAMRGDEQKLLAESLADGYVAKPIVDQDAFVAQVRQLVAGRKAA